MPADLTLCAGLPETRARMLPLKAISLHCQSNIHFWEYNEPSAKSRAAQLQTTRHYSSYSSLKASMAWIRAALQAGKNPAIVPAKIKTKTVASATLKFTDGLTM